LGSSSATSLAPTTIQDGGRTEAYDSRWVAKTLTSVSFIDNSINEWRRRLEGVIKNGDISSSVCFAR